MKNIFILLISVLLIGCEEPIETIIIDNMPMDVDGNKYHVVAIGDQEWFVEDLRVTHFNDGRPIRSIVQANDWINTYDPAYCKHNDVILYNYYCVESDMLAPKGWHIATDEEWKILEVYLGMERSEADKLNWRGDSVGDYLKSIDYDNKCKCIQDIYGFSAKKTGGRNGYQGDYIEGSYWWCGSSYDADNAYMRSLVDGYSTIYRGYMTKNGGFNVRCIRCLK
jgi:uncharacterized protein (TIGR02145 family)